MVRALGSANVRPARHTARQHVSKGVIRGIENLRLENNQPQPKKQRSRGGRWEAVKQVLTDARKATDRATLVRAVGTIGEILGVSPADVELYGTFAKPKTPPTQQLESAEENEPAGTRAVIGVHADGRNEPAPAEQNTPLATVEEYGEKMLLSPPSPGVMSEQDCGDAQPGARAHAALDVHAVERIEPVLAQWEALLLNQEESTVKPLSPLSPMVVQLQGAISDEQNKLLDELEAILREDNE